MASAAPPSLIAKAIGEMDSLIVEKGFQMSDVNCQEFKALFSDFVSAKFHDAIDHEWVYE